MTEKLIDALIFAFQTAFLLAAVGLLGVAIYLIATVVFHHGF